MHSGELHGVWLYVLHDYFEKGLCFSLTSAPYVGHNITENSNGKDNVLLWQQNYDAVAQDAVAGSYVLVSDCWQDSQVLWLQNIQSQRQWRRD